MTEAIRAAANIRLNFLITFVSSSLLFQRLKGRGGESRRPSYQQSKCQQ